MGEGLEAVLPGMTRMSKRARNRNPLIVAYKQLKEHTAAFGLEPLVRLSE